MTCKAPVVNLIYYIDKKIQKNAKQVVDIKKVCFTSNDVFFWGYISVTISKVNVPLGGDGSVKWRESNWYSPSYKDKGEK